MYENVKFIYCGLFSTDGDWIHPERTQDNWELILMVRGTAHLRIGDKDYVLEKDSAILLPAWVPHKGIKVTRDVSFYWIHFTDCPITSAYIPKMESYHITLLLRQVLHYSVDLAENQEACDYLARLILMELARNTKSGGNRRIHEAAEWIRNHADQPLKTEQIAARFQYHPDYMSKLFRQEFGMGLKEFIDSARMEKIKMLLLNSSEPLQMIAARCGFPEYKYFLKFFRQHQGVSPTAFRNTYYRGHRN